MTDIFVPKIPKKFYCETCDYRCSNKKDFNKHLLTRKHENTSKGLTNTDKKIPKIPKIQDFQCECGNIYKHRQSLFTHKQKCSMVQGEIKEDTKNYEIDKELLVKMLLKNQDVMEKLAEVMPQIGNQSHNTNSLNTTNNQFNIQMFLNEHCKNAMNLTDFIDSLPITSDTYDSTIENGLTKTITNMLLNGLNELDVLDRPIHCTDASRKTLYVKDDNVWEKDNELLHMMKGIRDLSLKQRTMIQKWQDVNEGWLTDENLQSRLTKLIGNSMTAIESDDKETGKIIRSISKNVYLDKDTKEQYLQ